MKTQIHDLRKVRMWYEVKELSTILGNSDSKIAKSWVLIAVSRYKKMSEEEFHEFSMKQRVNELVLLPYYPDVLILTVIFIFHSSFFLFLSTGMSLLFYGKLSISQERV
ncbi:MAG: hypothetical protein LLF80_09930 [Porphyromonadaceae bacterium]|nr:hypothetical protein [Porphyromonadaceae bacterium]